MRKIIVFLNSYLHGIAGGDVWVIEVMKRILKQNNNNEIYIVTSELGKKFCQDMHLKGENVHFLITTDESDIRKTLCNIIFVYLKRIVRGLIISSSLRRITDINTIIFASSIFLPDIIPIFAFEKGKKFTIFHMAAPNPLRGYRSYPSFLDRIRSLLFWINEKIALTLIKMSQISVFALPTTVDLLSKNGIDRNRIFITYNGVDFEYIGRFNCSEKKYHACWIGRAHPQKGVEDLLKAWKLVVEQVDNAKLLLAGPETENYIPLVERLDLRSNVDVKGFVPQEEKFKLMKESLLFVFPSYHESFPIAILEALACGLPIIAYDLTIYKKTYNDLLITVPVGNWKFLAKKIVETLGNVEKIKKFNKKITSSKAILKYSWDNIANNFWEVITTL